MILKLAIALLMLAGAATFASAAGSMPFPDGRYVTDQSICSLDEQTMSARFTDKLGRYVRIIEGSKLRDGYELFCDISKVRRSGSDVLFKATCDAEGETEVIDGQYVAIAKDAFALGKSVFRRCGSSPAASSDDEADASSDVTPSQVDQPGGNFPLASCAGWNGDVTRINGLNTKSASMSGRVGRGGLREFC